METCIHCGWKVTNEGYGWTDTFGSEVCFWKDGVEFAHGVRTKELAER